jgi:voltage-gated potassium channel
LNKKIEIFVSIITLASVIVLLIPSLYVLSPQELQAIYIFDLIVVFILGVDFYTRFKESGQGSRFLLTHCYEIPAMLPMILLVALDPGQSYVEAGIRSLRFIRLFRLVPLFFRTLKLFEGRRVLYIIAFSTLAVSLGAVAEYLIESSDPEAKITTIEDAFWWAIVTVTTVGYGDVYPVTAGGKIVAAMLMVVGIAILGILISTLGAGLIESRFARDKTKDKKTSEPSLAEETRNLIKNKIDKVAELNQEDFDNLISIIKNLRNMSHV